MKVQLEVDLPDDTAAVDIQGLLQEFRWLARMRGWRALMVLPSRKKERHEHDSAQG